MRPVVYVVFCIGCLSFFACEKERDISTQIPSLKTDERETASLEFGFEINKDVYLQTTFGEPPQIAIWLEFSDSTFYKSVWVTHRAGKNDWVGKVECSVALPYWESRRKNEKEKNIFEKIIDAVTAATVKEGKLQTRINVVPDQRLLYYIEVNASGDYSSFYPYWSDYGIPDTEGNGQPSIVYSGIADLKNNRVDEPQLVGRTDQLSHSPFLYKDIETITSAKNLIGNIRVSIVTSGS